MNAPKDELTLNLLGAIEKNSQTSQRKLANQNGVAIGLVNSYIKRCVQKGWVKVSDTPANRYLYYLTPQGFSEKMRLTKKFITHSFSFYRQAALSCDLILQETIEAGYKNIVLAGASNLAEIMILQSLEKPINVKAVYAPKYPESKFYSVVVWQRWQQDQENVALVLTDLSDPVSTIEELMTWVNEDHIYVPELLKGWFSNQTKSDKASNMGFVN